MAKLGNDEVARVLHPRLAVFLLAAHGQVLFDVGQGRGHGVIVRLDQTLVATDQRLQRDAFGGTEGQIQCRAGLGVLAHGLTGRDAMAKITLQHGFEPGRVDGADCAQASGTFALPGCGAAVSAVVVVSLVGVVVGGEGRTGPIDLAVRDHGVLREMGGVVKDQPAGAKGAPVLAVGGKGGGITQGFPQEMWINTVSFRPRTVSHYIRRFLGLTKKRQRVLRQ